MWIFVTNNLRKSSTEFPLIMKTIWNRLSERTPAEWRHVYKSLLLLDYMLKNGSYQVVTDAQAHCSVLRALGDYSAYEGGDDKGISGTLLKDLFINKQHVDNE